MARGITITDTLNDGAYADIVDACAYYRRETGESKSIVLKKMAEDSQLFRDWKKQQGEKSKKGGGR